ncbi:hypothetical protein TREMEDRAFT_73380 [Tremella mesenterica DSM 1558]|uniref:uncharacterized protein n=1 Tax=Tremella mesenterica (strain ATCC 24925 / CBS 8224 / DSM 1558 / NBRC 9311 / NRRL Y-6157 / RJB 2259-6 / UBC 559-6) TaxID=578456 RepID=UPI0003F4A587|nr:uncharacterized protein TREMEDRAFT_73380 [Tremella mesenterica DSM 1558]EIW71677.1 hypothetical protein TREMEDRAFT_73380 [Tremella mesenterica DSM 1558]
MGTPPPARKPGGARPLPPGHKGPLPPKLSIPEDNVPGINVDQVGVHGWHTPTSLPSLALKPRRPSPSLSPNPNRPKLVISALSSPTVSPLPQTMPLPRPQLLNASSSPLPNGRNGAQTPSLRLCIPGSSGLSSGFSSGQEYPSAGAEGLDSPSFTLKTPMAGAEDPNPTLRPRGTDEDGVSSYGFGRPSGLEVDQMSAMTEDIRQALSRSRFDASPSFANGQLNRSRANSTTDSNALSISGYDRNSSRTSLDEMTRRVDDEEKHSPIFDPSQLIFLRRLGEGTGGQVDLVKDKQTGRLMAKKVIARTPNPKMHKQLLLELEILNGCHSPHIVEHYGSFLAERDSQIGILMEYCEAGSLDSLLGKMKKTGMRCSEHVLGRIAASVLKGLDYLHQRRIIHRDIKPSNILLTREGVVKLCDFGVSGELIDSVAGTFTGTSYYMAPERIQGKPYSIKADVWSLGVSLHEVAHLRFPFPPEGENQSVAPIELLSYIVTAPVPVMIDDPSVGRIWSEPIKDFMAACLIRSGTDRPYPWQLLQHPFILTSEAKKVNMAKWVAALCDWSEE